MQQLDTMAGQRVGPSKTANGFPGNGDQKQSPITPAYRAATMKGSTSAIHRHQSSGTKRSQEGIHQTPRPDSPHQRGREENPMQTHE